MHPALTPEGRGPTARARLARWRESNVIKTVGEDEFFIAAEDLLFSQGGGANPSRGLITAQPARAQRVSLLYIPVHPMELGLDPLSKDSGSIIVTPRG